MKFVIKTIFITAIAVGVSQTAQAGKFKDFFTGKKDNDNVVQAVKSEKKEGWFKRTFKKGDADKPTVKHTPKPQPVVIVEPVNNIATRPAVPVYQGYKRIPRTLVASTWLQDSQKAAHIESEKELDDVNQLNDNHLLGKGKAKLATPKKQVVTTEKKKKWYKKSDEKGNWFSRTFKKDESPKK